MKIDPEKTLAIIVGVEKYDAKATLHELPAASVNAIKVHEVLKKKVGIPAPNLTRFIDLDKFSDLLEDIQETLAQQQWELVIFYYSGHALKNDDQTRLYLGTSSVNPARPDITGIDVEKLFSEYLNTTPLLAILDCCFAGKAFDFIRGRHNSYIMASSLPYETSKYPVDEEGSAFTTCLLHTINNGIESAGEHLTINELFDETQRKLLEKGYPEPKPLDKGGLGKAFLVENFFDRQSSLEQLSGAHKESELLYEALRKCNSSIIDQRKGLDPRSESFSNELKKLILSSYPYPIAYFLKGLLAGHIETQKVGFYRNFFKQVIAFLTFILIDDLVDNKREYEMGRLVSLNINEIDPSACLEALKGGCKKYSGRLFVKEFTSNADFIVAADKFQTLLQSNAPVAELRKCALQLIADLAFLSQYTLIAIRTIYVERGYCPPIRFCHENSVLMGEAVPKYEPFLIFDEQYLHNGTILLFRKPKNEKINSSDEHLNLWPLVVDANGFIRGGSSKPDLYLFSKIISKRFMYEVVDQKPLQPQTKAYTDINKLISEQDKEKYFSAFMNSYKNFFD